MSGGGLGFDARLAPARIDGVEGDQGEGEGGHGEDEWECEGGVRVSVGVRCGMIAPTHSCACMQVALRWR